MAVSLISQRDRMWLNERQVAVGPPGRGPSCMQIFGKLGVMSLCPDVFCFLYSWNRPAVSMTICRWFRELMGQGGREAQ